MKIDKNIESDPEKAHANPHGILSEDNEKINLKNESRKNKICENKDLAVAEKSKNDNKGLA